MLVATKFTKMASEMDLISSNSLDFHKLFENVYTDIRPLLHPMVVVKL